MLIHKKTNKLVNEAATTIPSRLDRKTRSLTEPIRLQNLENSARLQTEKKKYIYLVDVLIIYKKGPRCSSLGPFLAELMYTVKSLQGGHC